MMAPQIHKETLETIAEQSKDIEALQSPLLSRKDLNLDMAIKMADWVGESLRRFIGNRFEISENQLNKAVSDAVLEAIDDDIFGEMEWSAAEPEGPTEGQAVGPSRRVEPRQYCAVQTDIRDAYRADVALGGAFALSFTRSAGDRQSRHRA